MYSISGNKIHWSAKDVTPIILKCGIKHLSFNNTTSLYLSGDNDNTNIFMFKTLLDNISELPNVYGYPNKIVPAQHDDEINVYIIPSPHISHNYAKECKKLLTDGYKDKT